MILTKLYKSNLFKSSGLYTIFNVVDKVIPFLLLPIVTRYLLPEEYGVYVLYQALVGFLLPFVTLNTDSAILINYFKLKKTEFNVYLSNGVFIFVINLIIISVLYFLFKNSFSDLIDFPSNWLFAILLICPMQYLTKLVKNLWQVKKEVYKYGFFSISLTLFKNLLMILFIVVFEYKWEGLIISQLIGWGVFSIISISILLYNGYIKLKIKKPYIYDNIIVGSPLTLHQLGGWLGDLSSRLIIGAILGKQAVGSYGIGATFGLMVLLLQDAFNKAFVPYLFEELKKLNKEKEIKLVRITYLYNSLILIIGFGVGIVGYFGVGLIFGSEYESSKNFIIWLTLAYAFDGMYKSHVNYIFYSKKTYLLLLITLTTGVANVGLSYLLVSNYGVIGAAQALFFVYFTSYILAWYIGNRIIPMPWFSKKIFRY